MVPKFWFIWLWHLSICTTYKSKSLRNNKKDKKSELYNCFSYRGLPYFFRLAAELSELAKKFLMLHTQNSTLNVLWSQWPQKWPFQTFWKNQYICSKDWWEVWIVSRDHTKTKCPKQWRVNQLLLRA